MSDRARHLLIGLFAITTAAGMAAALIFWIAERLR